MKFHPAKLPGVILIEPDVYRDERGFFMETFQSRKYREGGVGVTFVQDNSSRSKKGILRGLHGQLKNPQGKLIRAVEGEIFDVAVDVRVGSPTFKQWEGVILSKENFRQLYIPPGFSHGYCVLSEVAEVEYKCSRFYDPNDEFTLLWSDPDIHIEWPLKEPLLSLKDQKASRIKDMMDRLPRWETVKT